MALGEELANYKNGIQKLRDMMSTLRWELMEEYSEIEKRENVDLRSFEKEKIKIIEEYPPLDWDYEETVIYKKQFDKGERGKYDFTDRQTDRQTEHELTGFPSIDKPWLKYYSEEAIQEKLPECTMYDLIYQENQSNLSHTALNYFGKKISYKLFLKK